jgi:quinohemoprotein ethanol dehydrogenase
LEKNSTGRVLALWVASVVVASVAAAQAAANPADWPSHNGNADETAYSPLRAINTGNVGVLGLAWSLDLEGESSLEATPLAINGILYFTGSYATVYAVDAVSGKLLWKFDPQTWKQAPAKMMFIFGVNHGVAYADGRIFSSSLDGQLNALNAGTGKLLWSVATVPAAGMKTVTGAPRTFNGKVIIGNAGADTGERGYVTAYEAATGQQLWRFYITPGTPAENKGDPAMERAAATWSGEYWKTGTGGAVWDSITFDPELNRIYLGTGNAGPYDPAARSPGAGDNLYTASIVALDADTGKYAWHYQVNPRDAWDYDSTQQMTLTDLVIRGERHKVLMQAPKNGFFYVLDRRTGQLLSAEKIGKATWAERIDLATGRPVEAQNMRYETGDTVIWPAPIGAHSWQSMSFSPKTGLVYIPYMQLGARFHRGQPEPGVVSVGGLSIALVKEDAQDGKGALLAWDPVANRRRWTVQLDTLWNGGTLATAGGLVFQGTADGYFCAYDASTGKRLWRFNAGLGIIAAPISYSAHGRQSISVLVGYGGSAAIGGEVMQAGWRYGIQPHRLLTFTLGATAVLPPTAPPDMSVKAVDDPSFQINDADVQAGHALFNMVCAACHGLNLRSAGAPGPDLRESGIALTEEGVWTVVHEGTLLSRGMPAFGMLGREQVRQIHAYIRAGAREALETRKP